MEKQILGVVGGMGPEATEYFYEQVIKHTEAHCDQDHIDMVILSAASMPDRTKAIETGDHERLLGAMRTCLERLEACSATQIAIPCNTSHYFYDDIQAMSQVPIIHMPRETVRACARDPRVRRIGIMGTDGTIDAGVYDRECERFGVTPIHPSPERQRDVMSLIYDDVKAGKTPHIAAFERVLAHFNELACDRIILACTELSVLKKYRDMPENVIDAMDVLAYEAITRCGKSYMA